MTYFEGKELHNSAVMGCAPRYFRTAVEATVDGRTAQLMSVTSVPGSQPENLTFTSGTGTLLMIDEALTYWADGQSNVLDGWFPENRKAFPPGVGISYSPWFYILAYMQNLAPYELLAPDQLDAAARAAFKDIWGHYAQALLFTSTNGSFDGNAISSWLRMVPREISFRLLQAIMVILAMGTIAVVLTHPQTLLARDPSSLASLATILASSPSLSELMEETGVLSEKALARHLQGCTFQLLSDPRRGVFLRVTRSEKVKMVSSCDVIGY
jgi:hypothetical protein